MSEEWISEVSILGLQMNWCTRLHRREALHARAISSKALSDRRANLGAPHAEKYMCTPQNGDRSMCVVTHLAVSPGRGDRGEAMPSKALLLYRVFRRTGREARRGHARATPENPMSETIRDTGRYDEPGHKP